MIRAIIYDLDGTFIDSTEAIVESFNHTFDALQRSRPPREAVVSSIGHTLEDQFTQFIDHDPDDCARIYREHYEVIACGKTDLLPGAEASLRRFMESGLRIGFATSKKLQYAEMILDHLGVLPHFESRIGPDEVSHPKPHPAAVLKSLDQLGVAPDEAFFIGDTDFDVKAAHAAHVRCLCVTTGYSTRAELEGLEPERVVDSLDAITAYVLQNRG